MKTILASFLPFTSSTPNRKKGRGASIANSPITAYKPNKRKLQTCFVARPPWGNSLLTELERIKRIFELTSV